MRILWFTNTPSNYKQEQGGYNGGGWISSLETEISKHKNIELAVSFILSQQSFKIIKNNVTYYPIELPKQNKLTTLRNIIYENAQIKNKEIAKFIKVIDDFKPDLIEIFGSEQSFGLIATQVNIPIVLHIQGLINPCYNAYLPPSISWKSLIKNIINPKNYISNYIHKKIWINLCYQEKIILQNINYFIGRTDWDRRISKIYNPQSHYFYGSEILRQEFYIPSHHRIIPEKLTIVSTISGALYKGFDLILKTANLLKHQYNIDFTWIVYGNIEPDFIEKHFNIKCKNVNIELKGVASPNVLIKNILHCTCFFHPSYIDNSPNSICEAQILGCTVISTNVGGISSLIKNNETGLLIPANDPYSAVSSIIEIHNNRETNKRIGNNAKKTALIRHDKNKIVEDLIKTYDNILTY